MTPSRRPDYRAPMPSAPRRTRIQRRSPDRPRDESRPHGRTFAWLRAALGAPLVLAVLVATGGCEDRGEALDDGNVDGAVDAGSGDATAAAGEPAPLENPFGFAVWHSDFPGAPEVPDLSPRQPGRWYDKSRQQALESVVDHLQGNCTRDAWLFAKDFAGRLPLEDLDVLITKLDAALQVPEMSDTVENVLGALGHAGHPEAAEAVLRALQHSKMSVRNAAMQALVGAGDADAVRRARALFDAVQGRGMNGWMIAARTHLPPEECAAAYRALLADPRYGMIHGKVVEHAVELPPKDALAALEAFAGRIPPSLRPMVAALRHANGDRGGSAELRAFLTDESPELRKHALGALAMVGPGELLDDVKRAATDPDPEVRLTSIPTLMAAEAPVDEIAPVLEILTIDEFPDVRRAAYRALVDLDRPEAVDQLVHVASQSTGTRLRQAVEDLVASRYVQAIPVLAERMQLEVGDQRRGMVRAIALTTLPEAFLPLREAFLSDDPEWVLHRGFVAYMMANCRGAELAVLELFDELPRDDYRRRGALLSTLGNIATEREDPEVTERLFARFREILNDADELPQIRLAALDYVRRDLDLTDVSRIGALIAASEPPMQKALNAFLFEFF